jgi:hypothetical protein
MKVNKVEVLGKPYSVKYLDDLDIAGNMGCAKRGSQGIRIKNDLGIHQEEESLLHEVIHIVDGELTLNLDEGTIARLAVGIYSAGYRLRRKRT